MSEAVFKFQNVRPPEPVSRDPTAASNLVETGRNGPPSEVRNALANALGKENSRELMRKIASDHLAGEERSATELIGPEIARLVDWASSNVNLALADLDLDTELAAACGSPMATFLGSSEVVEAESDLADAILAGALSGDAGDQAEISAALRVLHLAREVAAGRTPSADTTLGQLLDQMLVVLPSDATPPPPEFVAPTPPARTPAAERAAALRSRLDALETASREVADLIWRGGVVVVDEGRTEATTDEPVGRQVPAGLEDGERTDPDRRETEDLGVIASPVSDTTLRLGFDRQAFATLSKTTLAALAEASLESDNADPYATVAMLESQLARTSALVAAEMRPGVLIQVGETLIDADSLAGALGIETMASMGGALPEGSGYLPSPTEARCLYRAYVDDLLVVKQTLKEYELADFAHVENVMAGETREREHRRLDLSEETTTKETEQLTETEHDLQTTDRNEIQNEAKQVIKEESKLEAGLQVSGSYGPSISFQADTKGSFSKSSEQSKNKASTYSREITEKAVEKTRDRVREQRKRRVLRETEETNSHKFVGADDKHTRGIYRWLNKKYEAQIFEYGQRFMLELILPEPAAFYLYALVENPPSDLAPPKPPTFEGKPLKPENLTRHNYQQYVAAYQVRSVSPPPSAFVMASVSEKQEGTEPGSYRRAKKVKIEPGYQALAARVNGSYSSRLFSLYQSSHLVLVGDQYCNLSKSTGSYLQFGNPGPQSAWRGEISVVFSATNVCDFAASVDLFCGLTEGGLAEWQQEVYDAILESYLAMKSDYDESVTASTIGDATITGRNPLDNRRVEKDELKKLVVMALMNNPDLDLDPFRAGDEPVFDPLLAFSNESSIRFFEQAFEWSNMLYVFYPYFWGRRSRWRTLLNVTDTDSDFAAFLRAGAVRVQVPARPEFARVVARYLQTGDLPGTGAGTLFDDDIYVPIIDEITAKLGKPGDERPYVDDPEPWVVTVPTTLVVVQDLEEIPGIKDALTGTEIDLTSSNA